VLIVAVRELKAVQVSDLFYNLVQTLVLVA
jgi:hypothetical protein